MIYFSLLSSIHNITIKEQNIGSGALPSPFLSVSLLPFNTQVCKMKLTFSSFPGLTDLQCSLPLDIIMQFTKYEVAGPAMLPSKDAWHIYGKTDYMILQLCSFQKQQVSQ